MPTVDYLPIAVAGGANVESQAAFAGSGHQLTGFTSGIALSNQLNKCWRQSSMVAAAVANLIADLTGENVLDDGNLTNLIEQLAMTISMSAWCGTSGGSANAQTLNPGVARIALVPGMVFRFIAGYTNTGATTINPSSLGAHPVLKKTSAGLVALAGGEIIAGNETTIVWDGTQFQISPGSGIILPSGVSTLSADTAIGTSATALGTVTLTMPPAGNLKALISYNVYFNTGTSQLINCWVDDGTNQYAGSEALTVAGGGGMNGFQVSTANYAPGSTVTFTLYAICNIGATAKAAPYNAGGPNTQLQVQMAAL